MKIDLTWNLYQDFLVVSDLYWQYNPKDDFVALILTITGA